MCEYDCFTLDSSPIGYKSHYIVTIPTFLILASFREEAKKKLPWPTDDQCQEILNDYHLGDEKRKYLAGKKDGTKDEHYILFVRSQRGGVNYAEYHGLPSAMGCLHSFYSLEDGEPSVAQ